MGTNLYYDNILVNIIFFGENMKIEHIAMYVNDIIRTRWLQHY